MRKYFLSILLVVCIFSVISCNQQRTKWQGTVEEIDGITVINNPVEPIYKGEVFELKEELIIDSRRGETIDEDKIFQTIVSIDVDEYDNIFILDKKARV